MFSHLFHLHPQVESEEHHTQDFPDLRDFVTVDEVGDANDFPNSPPTDAVAMDTTVTVDKVGDVNGDLQHCHPGVEFLDYLP